MRKIVLLVAFIFCGAFCVQAQTVQVPQDYLDSSAKAFREVIALRSAVEAQKQAMDSKDQLVATQDALIKSQATEIKLREEELDYYRKLKCDKTSFFFGVIKLTRCR